MTNKVIIELDMYTIKMLKRLVKLGDYRDFPLKVDNGMLSNTEWWNTANLSDFDRIEFDLSSLRKALEKVE